MRFILNISYKMETDIKPMKHRIFIMLGIIFFMLYSSLTIIYYNSKIDIILGIVGLIISSWMLFKIIKYSKFIENE